MACSSCDKGAVDCFVLKVPLIRVVGIFDALQIPAKWVSEVLFTPDICQT